MGVTNITVLVVGTNMAGNRGNKTYYTVATPLGQISVSRSDLQRKVLDTTTLADFVEAAKKAKGAVSVMAAFEAQHSMGSAESSDKAPSVVGGSTVRNKQAGVLLPVQSVTKAQADPKDAASSTSVKRKRLTVSQTSMLTPQVGHLGPPTMHNAMLHQTLVPQTLVPQTLPGHWMPQWMQPQPVMPQFMHCNPPLPPYLSRELADDRSANAALQRPGLALRKKPAPAAMPSPKPMQQISGAQQRRNALELLSKTDLELVKLAQRDCMPGYSKMTKAQLVQWLQCDRDVTDCSGSENESEASPTMDVCEENAVEALKGLLDPSKWRENFGRTKWVAQDDETGPLANDAFVKCVVAKLTRDHHHINDIRMACREHIKANFDYTGTKSRRKLSPLEERLSNLDTVMGWTEEINGQRPVRHSTSLS